MAEYDKRLELSNQILTAHVTQERLERTEGLIALTDLAPDDWVGASSSKFAEFPISNDPCSGVYFEQLQNRVATEEFIASKNPVALLIGESALAANIQFIPEPTIVMTDVSSSMCNFLTKYIDSLRNINSRKEWVGTIIDSGNSYVAGEMQYQVATWNRSGYEHPFSSDAAFEKAQLLANEKVIVPWNLDITDSSELNDLASALREQEADITFMNLSNVIPFTNAFLRSTEWSSFLSTLPITPNAPILTTIIAGRAAQEDKDLFEISKKLKVCMLEQTGPFFGLANLGRANEGFSGKDHKYFTESFLGAITTRRYATSL